MMKFTYETQDDSKFLVYEKTTADVIDTMALGMLSNNMIEGIVPFIYAQADDTVYMKGFRHFRQFCRGGCRGRGVYAGEFFFRVGTATYLCCPI